MKNNVRWLYIQKVKNYGFKKIIEKVATKLLQSKVILIIKNRIMIRNKNKIIDFDYSFINPKEIKSCDINMNMLEYLNEMYLSHRFNILGSGWIKNYIGCESFGVYCKYNFEEIERQYENIDYLPIDWQLDIKTGYKWDKSKIYKRNEISKHLGVDIKVPWELSRFHHMFYLAISALNSDRYRVCNVKEFVEQMNDFNNNNKPFKGVNWICPMDIAIRITNIILSFHIFKYLDYEKQIDNKIENMLSRMAYLHGVFIINNLEKDKYFTNNHYLTDIAGLLIIACSIEKSERILFWLSFGLNEFITEVYKQFYSDGGHFESSSAYNRLCGEMVCICTAIILGLEKSNVELLEGYLSKNANRKKLKKKLYKIEAGKIIFPEWYVDKIHKMREFAIEITNPDGNFVQYGDNDEGRFIKMKPVGEFITNEEAEGKYLNLKHYSKYLKDLGLYENVYFDENGLDNNIYLNLLDSVLGKEGEGVAYSFIRALAKERILKKE